MRGRITFGLGALIGALGLLRLANDDERLCNVSAALGAWSATAVLVLAFYELDRLLALANSDIFAVVKISVVRGTYYTIVGGFIAFFASLFGLAPERSSPD